MVPSAPDSEAPKPLLTWMPGISSANSSWTLRDKMAPPDPRTLTDERSYSEPCARIASASGRAIASPTTATIIGFSRSIVRSASIGSKRRIRIVLLPPNSAMNRL